MKAASCHWGNLGRRGE